MCQPATLRAVLGMMNTGGLGGLLQQEQCLRCTLHPVACMFPSGRRGITTQITVVINNISYIYNMRTALYVRAGLEKRSLQAGSAPRVKDMTIVSLDIRHGHGYGH